MPTYLYNCKVHGEFEEDHSINENLEECPQCKKEGKINSVTRLISSGTQFILSGSGWARDSYNK